MGNLLNGRKRKYEPSEIELMDAQSNYHLLKETKI